jgi:hypothetical protein
MHHHTQLGQQKISNEDGWDEDYDVLHPTRSNLTAVAPNFMASHIKYSFFASSLVSEVS